LYQPSPDMKYKKHQRTKCWRGKWGVYRPTKII
jgi:hypothetical protein